MDSKEQPWTLRYYTRPGGNRASPVFTVGWLQFVRAKSLKVGDKLTFYGHQVRAADGELQVQFRIQVMDSKEQPWTLRYYTRPSGNRASPVFTVGWLQFVRAKSLKVGDELTFYGHQVRAADGELQVQFRIQVTRKSIVTYQGQPVYLDVENFL
ncbi:hypothetical protein LWI29_001412 [Acer saccharum]|uniref:TF-B3 domain-containing protein n=1 Tax=Acer saccharum TaxID=4024 RepID=A0AA39STR4_ACESA|nr:hypothetical protein LWI29_001412 [Acer saccharum]